MSARPAHRVIPRCLLRLLGVFGGWALASSALAFSCLFTEPSDGIDFSDTSYLDLGFPNGPQQRGQVLLNPLPDISGSYFSQEIIPAGNDRVELLSSSGTITRLERYDMERQDGFVTRYRADLRMQLDSTLRFDTAEFFETVLEGSFDFWVAWELVPTSLPGGWQGRVYLPRNTVLEGPRCSATGNDPLICQTVTEVISSFGLCHGPFVTDEGDRAYAETGLELVFATRLFERYSLDLDRVTGFPVGSPSSVQSVGTIQVQVGSADPLALIGDDPEVREATVTVFRQDGLLLPRQQGETEAEFQKRLNDTLSGNKVTSTYFTRDDNGLARFDGLDLATPLVGESGETEQLLPVLYAVQVSGARTAEANLDTVETDDTVTTGFFSRTILNQLPVGGTPITVPIDLRVAEGVSRKRDMADTLADAATLNLTPLEGPGGPVQTWLDGIEAQGGGPTQTEIEAVNRAYWAELAARDAYGYADPLVEASLNAAGTLAAQVVEFMVGAAIKHGTSRKQRQAKRELASGDAVSKRRSENWRGMENAQSSDLVDDIDFSGFDDFEQQLQEDLATLLKAPVKIAIQLAKSQLAVDGETSGTVDAVLDGFGVGLEGTIDAVMTGSSGLGGVGTFAIENAVKLQKNRLLDSDSDAAVARRLRGPLPPPPDPNETPVPNEEGALRYSYDRMISWDSLDEGEYRRDRDLATRRIDEINDRASRSIRRVIAAEAVVEATGRISEALETVGALGDVFPAKRLVETINNLLNKGALFGLFALPMREAYYLPTWAQFATYEAFGEIPRVPLTAQRPGVLENGVGSDVALIDSLSPAIDGVTASLAALDAALADDNPPAMLSALVDETTGLSVRSAGFRTEARLLLDQALSADYGTSPVAGLVADLALARGARQLEQLEIYERSRALVYDILLGRFSGPGDPLYLLERDRLSALIGETTEALATMKTDLVEVIEDSTLATFTPVVVVTKVEVRSQTTGLSSLSADGERFTIMATVANATAAPLADIAIRLTADAPGVTVNLVDSAVQSIGTLAGNDGVPATGEDRKAASWTLEFVGDFNTGPTLPLQFEVLEGGAAPTSFVASRHLSLVRPNPRVADADDDLLTLSYELEHGLDPTMNDALEDKDGDTLSNLQEQGLRTLASEADSDDDGLDDGEEVNPGVDGVRTDPLVRDTDGDGVDDGDDPAPIDPFTPGGTSPATLPRVVQANSGEPSVVLDTENLALPAVVQFPLVGFTQRIEVSNGGAGELRWKLETPIPEILSVVPPPGVVQTGPGEIIVSMLRPWPYATALQLPIRVIDVSGAVRDEVVAQVKVGGGDIQAYELRTSVAGEGRLTSDDGAIDCGSDCIGDYAMGTTVTLTPAPAAGWFFAGWQDGADCSGPLVLTGNRNCRAVFLSGDLLFRGDFEFEP